MSIAEEQRIFSAALKIMDPDKRDAFLMKSCGDDSGLYLHLNKLLKLHDQSEIFFDFVRIFDVDDFHISEGQE